MKRDNSVIKISKTNKEYSTVVGSNQTCFEEYKVSSSHSKHIFTMTYNSKLMEKILFLNYRKLNIIFCPE
jgi:hypothetical protein